MESAPEELIAVRGISLAKAKRIGERYAEIKEMQHALVFLQKFEISLNMAIRIYNHYKDATQEQVQTNPYALIETIDGIGFLTADQMAREIGIDYAGAFRVRAGVVYVLKQSAEADGDTWLPLEKLKLGVCRLLKIKMEQLTKIVDRVVRELCMDKYLTAVPNGVMLTKFYVAERAVAARIAMLNAGNVAGVATARSVRNRDRSNTADRTLGDAIIYRFFLNPQSKQVFSNNPPASVAVFMVNSNSAKVLKISATSALLVFK
jgi:exodeoxyribonuclease V alpha subunit